MRIAYFPAGPRTFASSRMRCYRPGEALEKLGHEVSYAALSTVDVVVIQKRYDLPVLMQDLRQRGVRVIFDVDDMMFDLSPFELADVVTTDTEYKREQWPTAVVVPDCLDLDDDAPKKSVQADYLKRAVWIGSAENVYHIRYAAEACNRLGIELIVITDTNSPKFAAYSRDVTGVQWSLDTVDQQMIECDVCLCPYVISGGEWGEAWVRSKSENRIVKAYGLGLPVIGTPIPSYVSAGLQYCAETTEEWIAALQAISPRAAREVDAERGYLIAQQYRAEVVAEKWLEVFKG